MLTIILRSVCCGIAAAVIAVPGYIVASIWYVARRTPAVPAPAEAGGFEVGWDLMTMSHNATVGMSVWLLVAFAIGFLWGYWYFSRAARG